MNRKELDLTKINIEVGRIPHSVSKYLSRMKATGKVEEAKAIRHSFVNKKKEIREREDHFFNQVKLMIKEEKDEKVRNKELNELEEFKLLTPEEAKIKIGSYEKVNPEQREEKFDLEEHTELQWKQVVKSVSGTPEWKYEQYGLFKYLALLKIAHPDDLDYLFSFDGKGKAVFIKLRDKVSLKR